MSFATSALLRSCTAQTRLVTPLGSVLIARTASGVAGIWFEGQKHHPPELPIPHREDDALLAEASRQLNAYFSGGRNAFSLPLDLQGTPFQRSVWAVLLEIPAAQTRSYGEVARQLNAASAVRAVGSAIGRNPACIVVPCHRVVGSSGSLTGYAGGMERKRALLRLETLAASAAPSGGSA